MKKETILVVDDEEDILELVRYNLDREGYAVACATTGEKALKTAASEKVDLIILDLMLPGIDGLEVAKRLKRNDATKEIPIVMLTAKGEEADVVSGLELGADDYVTKPFNPRELVARVRAVLRRYQKSVRPDQAVVVGQLRVDPASREARLGETLVELRPKEFDLLLALVEHQGLVMSRDQLLDLVWGYDFPGGTRTVDAHISHLRSRLEGSGVEIETHRGIGYKLVG